MYTEQGVDSVAEGCELSGLSRGLLGVIPALTCGGLQK